jgi:hypothetical protein
MAATQSKATFRYVFPASYGLSKSSHNSTSQALINYKSDCFPCLSTNNGIRCSLEILFFFCGLHNAKLKAKEELWKLKYFTMQRYNLQKFL